MAYDILLPDVVRSVVPEAGITDPVLDADQIGEPVEEKQIDTPAPVAAVDPVVVVRRLPAEKIANCKLPPKKGYTLKPRVRHQKVIGCWYQRQR